MPALDEENTKDIKEKPNKKELKDIEKEQSTNNDTDKGYPSVYVVVKKNVTESGTDVNDMSKSDVDTKHMADNHKHRNQLMEKDADKKDVSKNDTDAKHPTEKETDNKNGIDTRKIQIDNTPECISH